MFKPSYLAIAALAATTLTWAPSATAQPKWVRLSLPESSAATTMRVAANTDTDVVLTVHYGETAAFGSQAVMASSPSNPSLGFLHEAELTGLKPAATYHYVVKDAGGAASPAGTFTTAPPDSSACPEFNFVAVGDGRSDNSDGPSPRWPKIMGEALDAAKPSFVINSGDIVRDGGDVKQWVNWLDATAPLMHLFPHMPSLGNHDDGGPKGDGPDANYNQIFFLPRNPASKTGNFTQFADVEDFYYFRYANALFIAISTATFEVKDQAAWMDAVFAAHPDVTWRFVYFHHPIYSSNPLGLQHDPNEVGQNPLFVPIFDKHHVDFVVNGHNHFYERFQPSKGGTSDEAVPQPTPKDGTIYLVSGGSGSFTNPLSFCKAEGSEICTGDHHYVQFTIRGPHIRMLAQATAAQKLGEDPKNRHVIDTLEFSKPFTGADPCTTAPPIDEDGDGYSPPGDCDDKNPFVNPGEGEVCDDTADNDCNKKTDKDDPACAGGEGTEGSSEGSEGSEGTGEGTEGAGEGPEGTAEGTEGSAEGAEGASEGTEGTIEGPEGTAEGTEGSVEGTEGAIEGAEGTPEGNEGSLEGAEGTPSGEGSEGTPVSEGSEGATGGEGSEEPLPPPTGDSDDDDDDDGDGTASGDTEPPSDEAPAADDPGVDGGATATSATPTGATASGCGCGQNAPQKPATPMWLAVMLVGLAFRRHSGPRKPRQR